MLVSGRVCKLIDPKEGGQTSTPTPAKVASKSVDNMFNYSFSIRNEESQIQVDINLHAFVWMQIHVQDF